MVGEVVRMCSAQPVWKECLQCGHKHKDMTPLPSGWLAAMQTGTGKFIRGSWWWLTCFCVTRVGWCRRSSWVGYCCGQAGFVASVEKGARACAGQQGCDILDPVARGVAGQVHGYA